MNGTGMRNYHPLMSAQKLTMSKTCEHTLCAYIGYASTRERIARFWHRLVHVWELGTKEL